MPISRQDHVGIDSASGASLFEDAAAGFDDLHAAEVRWDCGGHEVIIMSIMSPVRARFFVTLSISGL